MIEYEDLNKLNSPFFTQFEQSFADTLKSGWFILGNKVCRFEEEFAAYVGSKYCVGLASGLDALILSLKAFDFPTGSEVIVPSNTYIATILAIVHLGFVPVLVEPDLATYNIDPEKIEEKITKKTRAILVVHLYGKSCKMDSITELCGTYDLKLIEDCAQSHGAKFNGQTTGSFGDFGAFSFYPTKNLGALGDAGAITTDDEHLAAKIRGLRNYGSFKKYYNDVVGYNSRLDEVQAGFLSIKLKKLDDINSHKRRLAELYLTHLNAQIIKPVTSPAFYDVYHIFNIRTTQRDSLKKYLLDRGIKTEIHYPVAPNRQKAMQGILDQHETPIAEEIHQTTLSLPISYFHTTEDVMFVIDEINRFVENGSNL